MKKIISITIALCLIFASILPVYADPWSSQQAQTVTSNSTGILSHITNINSLFTQFFTIRNISGGNVTATFQDFYDLFSSLCKWIMPSGSTSTTLSLWDFSLLIAQRVNDLWGGWDSYFSNLTAIPVTNTLLGTNNNILTSIRNALYNYSAEIMNYGTWSWSNASKYAHTQLLGNDPFGGSLWTGAYQVQWLSDDGTYSTRNYRWDYGSPIGNVVLMEDTINHNLLASYTDFRTKFLTHYHDNLTTWDSQGSTLTQVSFTPDSAIQGLYRYLAFTQRDVARLAYVFANDEELEARQLAQANQEQIIDDFIDPNGSGSVSTTDFNAMAGASDSVKDNFNTGYSSSNVWDIFNSDHYGWFSQECADSLDTTVSNNRTLKSGSGYNTPLLDSYYEQILSLGGDN